MSTIANNTGVTTKGSPSPAPLSPEKCCRPESPDIIYVKTVMAYEKESKQGSSTPHSDETSSTAALQEEPRTLREKNTVETNRPRKRLIPPPLPPRRIKKVFVAEPTSVTDKSNLDLEQESTSPHSDRSSSSAPIQLETQRSRADFEATEQSALLVEPLEMKANPEKEKSPPSQGKANDEQTPPKALTKREIGDFQITIRNHRVTGLLLPSCSSVEEDPQRGVVVKIHLEADYFTDLLLNRQLDSTATQ